MKRTFYSSKHQLNSIDFNPLNHSKRVRQEKNQRIALKAVFIPEMHNPSLSDPHVIRLASNECSKGA